MVLCRCLKRKIRPYLLEIATEVLTSEFARICLRTFSKGVMIEETRKAERMVVIAR